MKKEKVILFFSLAKRRTVVKDSQESELGLSISSFARTAHSFACSALLVLLARYTALTRSLARSLIHSQSRG